MLCLYTESQQDVPPTDCRGHILLIFSVMLNMCEFKCVQHYKLSHSAYKAIHNVTQM